MQDARQGVFWSGAERLAQQLVRLTIQIVLARLLTPYDFGIVALVSVFVVIGDSLTDAGFSKALIQRAEISKRDATTVFYFNLVVSVIIVGVLLTLAPMVAMFYNDDELTTILRALSFGVILSSFSAVPQALLNRDMMFKELFKITFPSVLASGLIGIAVAYNGGGSWSLVAQVLSQRLLNSILIFQRTNWRPCGLVSLESFKNLAPFSFRLGFTNVLDTSFQQIYTIAIGKCFSPIDVGIYQRAKILQQVPVTNIRLIAGRVAFPYFSKLNAKQSSDFRPKFAYSIKMLSAVSFPTMTLLALSAPLLIPILLGNQWTASIKILQILCIVGILYPIQAMNLQILMAKGRSDLFLRLEVAKKIVTLFVLAITVHFGLLALVIGQVVVAVIALSINTHYSGKFLNYGLVKQLYDMAPYFLSLIPSSMFVILLNRTISHDINILVLCIQIIGFILVYVLTLYISGLEAAVELRRIWSEFMRKVFSRA